MNSARMLAAAALAGIALTACGGVDREGTRDNIIESFQTEVGAELDTACVDGVIDDYSDDDLQAIDDAINDNEMTDMAQTFALAIFECVPGS